MQQKDDFEGKERRRYKRYPFQYLVDFFIGFRRTGEADFQMSASGNISYGGALMLSPHCHTIGERVEVKVSYCGDDGRLVETIYQTEVRWVDESSAAAAGEKTYIIGVQFLDMSEEQRGRLEYFIETFIKGPQSDGAA